MTFFHELDADKIVPFGEIQGHTPNGVPAFSNGSDQYFSGERNFDERIFTGFRWQCVEFARRWLLETKGLLLGDVPWACQIFNMKTVERVSDGAEVRMVAVDNGGTEKPTADTYIIYPSSPDNTVGHIAVITEVGEGWVRIADQNHRFHKWENNCSAQLEVRHENGKYTIVDGDMIPLGWMTFPDTPNRDHTKPLEWHPKYVPPTYDPPFLQRRTVVPTDVKPDWLDVTNAAEKKFVDTYGMDVSRARLNESEVNYYAVNFELYLKLTAAANPLHRMFIKATERVLADDALLKTFDIAEEFWPRIRRSFQVDKHAISGRFDFAFDGTNIKCFEYNADSAGTLLESAVVQDKYAKSIGIAGDNSRSAAFRMSALLTAAWKEAKVTSPYVHLCIDTDDEEQYNGLFMEQKAQEAGLKTKLCIGWDRFRWQDGKIFDTDGVEVKTVWKFWNWENALLDLEQARKERGPNWKPTDGDKVRLSDVVLFPDDSAIRVLEPFWKIIPSNKAILAVLWEMYPNHPNLLRTEWSVSDALRATGYAKKPIVGRCGRNVTIVAAGTGETLKETAGEFSNRDFVYQERMEIPCHDGYYGILGGWMLGNYFGGGGIREDKTLVTGVESPFSCLRIEFNFKVPTPVTHATVAADREATKQA